LPGDDRREGAAAAVGARRAGRVRKAQPPVLRDLQLVEDRRGIATLHRALVGDLHGRGQHHVRTRNRRVVKDRRDGRGGAGVAGIDRVREAGGADAHRAVGRGVVVQQTVAARVLHRVERVGVAGIAERARLRGTRGGWGGGRRLRRAALLAVVRTGLVGPARRADVDAQVEREAVGAGVVRAGRAAGGRARIGARVVGAAVAAAYAALGGGPVGAAGIGAGGGERARVPRLGGARVAGAAVGAVQRQPRDVARAAHADASRLVAAAAGGIVAGGAGA